MTKKIGIIIGSNRPKRIGGQIADWVKKTMEHPDLELEIIDLAQINLPFLDEEEIPAHGNYTKEYTIQWSTTIQSYDGFVLVFPQYNWGYPAVLKNALDYLYDEWKHKPVSLIVYGGHGGFQASIAMQLVTKGLSMYNLSVNPSLEIKEQMFDEDNQFLDIEQAFSTKKLQVQMVSEEFANLLNSRE